MEYASRDAALTVLLGRKHLRRDRYKKITFISVDVETDGPIPGPNSMLQLGAVAFGGADGLEMASFSVNFATLIGSVADPKTAAWWAKPENTEKYWETRKAMVEPEEAIQRFVTWVESLPGTKVFVAYPAGFDFLFVYWYMMRFVGRSPFSFSALDIKTYAAALLDVPFRDVSKKTMPEAWMKDLPPHTHSALDDAREQGVLFLRMLKHRGDNDPETIRLEHAGEAPRGTLPDDLDNEELYLLLVSAVRYALGRMTYIVSTTCDSVRKYKDRLTASQREVIARDIREARDYGMAMDKAQWLRLLTDLTT